MLPMYFFLYIGKYILSCSFQIFFSKLLLYTLSHIVQYEYYHHGDENLKRNVI
jgi:hypothetical protein